MNLNQLRFAKAVAEHRSFSRAAEECRVTQPTLSNAIAQLEKELDGKLHSVRVATLPVIQAPSMRRAEAYLTLH